jgi:hypothetical protein
MRSNPLFSPHSIAAALLCAATGLGSEQQL